MKQKQQNSFKQAYRSLLTSESWDCEITGDGVWAKDLFVASGDDRQKHRSMASCSKQLVSAAKGNGADSTLSPETHELAQFSDKPQPSSTQSWPEDCTSFVASKPLKSFHSSLSTLLVDNFS